MYVTIADGAYLFIPHFIDVTSSAYYFEFLKNHIKWSQHFLNLYGKRIPFPRLTALYGDEGKDYQYAHQVFSPLPWLPELLKLKHLIEPYAGQTFNSVLLNYYRNGQDSISWHADNESELGINPVIASLNFGESRRFILRHNEHKTTLTFQLNSGSLLIMRGPLQHHWQHQIPKTKQHIGGRINLTFRTIF